MIIKNTPDWSLEDATALQGWKTVVGVDEAGRGPWAGPVVAAAAWIPPEARSELPVEVNDSKRLKASAREAIVDHLLAGPGWKVAVGVASVEEIDQHNILRATFLAMRRAIAGLDLSVDFLLVDGKHLPGSKCTGDAVVKGDQRSLSIATASILAKVTRDRIMTEEVERRFPGYGFARHKGYGTRFHQQALARLGPCPVHRRSFGPIRRLVEAGASDHRPAGTSR